MTTIERAFLRAKPWRLFLLLVGIMVVGQIVVVSSFPVSAPSPQDFGRGLALVVRAAAVLMLFLLGWFWSMGSFLSSITPRSHRLSISVFRLTVIYPGAYIVALCVAASLKLDLTVPVVIFPFHLLATLCMFYDLYFVSKSLVLVESGRPVAFYDFSGPFFLLWFFPIGVWVIQPRINRLLKSWMDTAQKGATDRA